MNDLEIYEERGQKLVEALQSLSSDHRLSRRVQNSPRFQAILRDDPSDLEWVEEESYVTSYGVSGEYLNRFRFLASFVSSLVAREPKENSQILTLANEVLEAWKLMFRDDIRRLLKNAMDDLKA